MQSISIHLMPQDLVNSVILSSNCFKVKIKFKIQGHKLFRNQGRDMNFIVDSDCFAAKVKIKIDQGNKNQVQ